MSTKLQILRHGHIIEEYESLEHLKTIAALLDDTRKIIEFIAGIQMALTLYRAGVRSGSFKIGSIGVKFQQGDEA